MVKYSLPGMVTTTGFGILLMNRWLKLDYRKEKELMDFSIDVMDLEFNRLLIDLLKITSY